jgi:hypothetical protein
MRQIDVEKRKAYVKKYAIENKEYLNKYQSKYWDKHYKKKHIIMLHPDTEKVLESLPNPFGSFEKAKYIIYRDLAASVYLYSFVTTCRNTEDCIELMKAKFVSIHKFKKRTKPKYCSIYKIQNGIKKLIFRDII